MSSTLADNMRQKLHSTVTMINYFNSINNDSLLTNDDKEDVSIILDLLNHDSENEDIPIPGVTTDVFDNLSKLAIVSTMIKLLLERVSINHRQENISKLHLKK